MEVLIVNTGVGNVESIKKILNRIGIESNIASIDEDFKDYPCRCGSKNCCGYIVREGSRWRIKKNKIKKK